MKNITLPIKIILGLTFGLICGFIFKNLEWISFTKDFIKPFGTIFINLLKMIAIPLIIVSIINGIADLKDVSRLSKLGLKTLLLFLFTTVVSVTIGLILVNIIKPGDYINKESREVLLLNYAEDASKRIEIATNTKEMGPLQFLVDIVLDNFFNALTQNTSMLQVIFFSILLGIGIVSIPEEKSKPVVDFFNSLNEVIMKVIEIIMQFSPIGVFALMCSLVVEISDFSVLRASLKTHFFI